MQKTAFSPVTVTVTALEKLLHGLSSLLCDLHETTLRHFPTTHFKGL